MTAARSGQPGAGDGQPGAADGADAEPAGKAGKKPGKEPKKKRSLARELLTIVVTAAVLTLVVKAFVVQVYKIPSGSMENTLLIGDRVLVNKVLYHLRPIARGDIVVFSGQGSWGPDAPPPPANPALRVADDVLSGIGLRTTQTYYIKRVIGLPGDHVACCTDGKVTVNGVKLDETSYLYPGNPPSFPFSVVVPAGHLWVMGDHRSDSDDSRYHTGDPGGGAIPKSAVVGRAFAIIWPPSQINDLPIPSTFQQAALQAGPVGAAVRNVSGAALGAVAAVPAAIPAGTAGLAVLPLLAARRRRRRPARDRAERS